MLLYILTFSLAFCSIVYELLLAQTLSAFLGNTVLRFSVTIGLYLLSMGIGPLLMRGNTTKNPVTTLQKVELGLALGGAGSVASLFLLDWAGMPSIGLSIFAHSLILGIGFLTGLEIPLLIEIRNRKKKDSEAGVLGIDYLGAFAGTLIFAFLFYPKIGLVPTSFIIATVNSVAGIFLIRYSSLVARERKKLFTGLVLTQVVLACLFIYGIFMSESVNDFLIQLYLT
ncbi:MAG: hypothetical protein CMO55_26030 [Verrucomicrobiales bacterium]|nr:hypothetical protein [Verrucomicrobiales bacterium]